MQKNGALIKSVAAESLAAEYELEPGDRLISINGSKLRDYIDYLSLSAEDELTLEVLKSSGEIWEIELEKDSEENLGFEFEELLFDGIRACKNRCLFCFVHQLPKEQRDSLYIQDDDFRLSFLHGCYITLTNLDEADWQRIMEMRLSPLYISVHATEPLIRQKLLGCKAAGKIMPELQRLVEAGITIHTQAVLCPGINDGVILEQTIKELAALWPKVNSLAVVPVGLTEHRRGLFALRPYNAVEAKQVVETLLVYQDIFLKKFGTRFVFPADEWYIIANQEIPPEEFYEDYLQLDNGVGLVRWFLSEFEAEFPRYQKKLAKIQAELVILTGESALVMWQKIKFFFEQTSLRLKLEIIPVKNSFLGATVTVTGLLAGNDLKNAILLHDANQQTVYLIPQITLKQDEAVFLDGVSLADLYESCQPKKVRIVPAQAGAWLEWLTENAKNI